MLVNGLGTVIAFFIIGKKVILSQKDSMTVMKNNSFSLLAMFTCTPRGHLHAPGPRLLTGALTKGLGQFLSLGLPAVTRPEQEGTQHALAEAGPVLTEVFSGGPVCDSE